MKKIIACLLCLTILFSAACADPVSSRTPIVIDGVRAAFFSSAGDYLPPLEEDGMVWVPAEALGENMGLNITADPGTAAVSKDGIRVAVFDAEGNYLAPKTIDGTVYVPLVPFAESTGMQVEASGDKIELRRSGTAVQETTAPPEPTAVPEPTATPLPSYVSVKLTLSNYHDYFMLDQDYYAPENVTNFYVTYTARIRATTSYGLNNVAFTLNKYGTVQIPATGQATISYRSESVYYDRRYFDEEKMWTITGMKTKAILETSGEPTVTGVSGSVLLPWSVAEAMWEQDYINAAGRIGLVSKSSAYDSIISTLSELAAAGYKDSEEQLKTAREKKAELAAKEEKAAKEEAEKKKAESYQAAEDALAEGKYQEAETAFAALAGYRDSEARAAEARNAGHEAEYQEAEALILQEDYDQAITLWTKLGEAGYRDSADRLEQTQELKNTALYREAVAMRDNHQYEEAIAQFETLAKIPYSDSSEQITVTEQAREDYRFSLYDGDYQAALELEKSYQFAEAITAFETLDEAGYLDSGEHLAYNRRAEARLEEQKGAYEKGIKAEQNKKWGDALDTFLTCLDYSNARAHAAACMLNAGDAWILPPSEGRFFFMRGDISGYGNINSGEFTVFTDYEVDRSRSTASWKYGLCTVGTNGRRGLLNADGETVIPVGPAEITFRGGYIAATGVSGGTELYDLRGNRAFEGSYHLNKHTDYLTEYSSHDKQKGELLLTEDGRVFTAGQNEFVILSNDGTAYRVRKDGSQETLLDANGAEVFTADQFYHDLENISRWEPWHMYNGVIAFRNKNSWGLYDVSKGKQIVKPSWQRVYPFTENGVARYSVKNKFGLMSAAGKQITGNKYESLGPICDGLAKASKYANKKINSKTSKILIYGFVNENGREIIPLKYIQAGDFSDGYGVTWAGTDNGVKPTNKKMTQYAYFLLDKDGKETFSIKRDNGGLNRTKFGVLLPDVFMLVYSSNYGILGLYHRDGTEILRCTGAEKISDELVAAVNQNTGSKTLKYTVIDNEGHVLYTADKQPKETVLEAVSTKDGHMIYNPNGQGVLADRGGKKMSFDAPGSRPDAGRKERMDAAAYAAAGQ